MFFFHTLEIHLKNYLNFYYCNDTRIYLNELPANIKARSSSIYVSSLDFNDEINKIF